MQRNIFIMPKWILGTKRRRSKETWEPVDHKKQEETPLHEGACNAACPSSDSGCSMSPMGSSSSEQDPGERTLELEWKPSCSSLSHTTLTSEGSSEEPLNLSLKDLRGGSSGSSFARASEDQESSANMLRRLKMVAHHDVVPGAKGHVGLIHPEAIAHQIQMHLFDAKFHHHHHRQQQQHQQQQNQQQQQQQQLIDHHPFPRSSCEPKSTGKKLNTKKRPLSADGDDEYHVAEALVTPEALAKLERIENKIGGYDCKLCANRYSNAFDLANHNCSGIIKVEHRCPECNKVFQCPANLASHRRWHGLRASNRESSWSAVASPTDAKDLIT